MPTLTLNLLVRTFAATILALSAGLKFIAVVNGGILSEPSVFLPPWLVVILVIVEASIAWSLLFYHESAISLLAGLVIYALLFGSAAILSWLGSMNCGCFGPISVKTWIALVIDFVSLIFLWSIRPASFAHGINTDFRKYSNDLKKGRNFLHLLGFACIGLTCSFLIGTSTGRDLTGLPTFNRLVAPITDIGTGPPDSWVEGEVSLINWTNISAKVMGSKTSCGCLRVAKLIPAIPANEIVSIPFRLHRPKLEGEFSQQMTLYIDHPQQYFVNAVVVGQVLRQ